LSSEEEVWARASAIPVPYYAPAPTGNRLMPPMVGALSDDARLTSVCRVHRA